MPFGGYKSSGIGRDKVRLAASRGRPAPPAAPALTAQPLLFCPFPPTLQGEYALENYTVTKAVYQSLEDNQPWI